MCYTTTPVNFLANSDLAVEPREESASWFHPCIVKNATRLLSLVNDMDNPIKIKKGQIIGHVRSVVLPSDKPSADSIFTVSPGRMQHYNSNVDIIAVDPGNILIVRVHLSEILIPFAFSVNFYQVSRFWCKIYRRIRKSMLSWLIPCCSDDTDDFPTWREFFPTD